ncbi:MAG: MraY family glycosyltransferase [Acidobacteriota bacterium]
MRSYLILFSVSLLFALGLTPVVRRWALQWGAVDVPDSQRRIHEHPTPRLGGVAVYLAFLATLVLTPWLGTLVSQNLLSSWRTVAWVLAGATVIFALGVYDDFRGADAKLKLAVQLTVAAGLYFGGFSIGTLSSPFGGGWELPFWLSLPLTMLWIVGLTNAFNLIDGIDGLASGASAFALLSLFLCSLAQSHPEVSLMSIVLVGAVIGFLRYNFNPATIFLGDSGSLMLGYMAAVLSLVSAQKSPTLIAIAIPLVSFGLPVMEVGVSLSRRFLSGAPLFDGDRRHIHHMLLRRGLTQRQAVVLLYGICALFTLFGLMLLNPQRNKVALILFVLGAGIVLGVRQLRYSEFDALGSSLKRGVAGRKRSLTARARWLNNLEKIREARTMDDLLSSLEGLCETHGLTAARLEVTNYDPIRSGHNGHYAHANGHTIGLHWLWARAKGGNHQTLRDNAHLNGHESELAACWSLRLPLLNNNGENIGAFTLYHALANGRASDTMPADLAQTTELLSRELSAAFNGLRQSYLLDEHAPAIKDYLQKFNRDRTNGNVKVHITDQTGEPVRGA